MLNHVQLFVTQRIPLTMEFSMQEYWSGLSFPSLGNLPDPGIKLASFVSPALTGGFLPLCHLRAPHFISYRYQIEKKKISYETSQVLLS